MLILQSQIENRDYFIDFKNKMQQLEGDFSISSLANTFKMDKNNKQTRRFHGLSVVTYTPSQWNWTPPYPVYKNTALKQACHM